MGEYKYFGASGGSTVVYRIMCLPIYKIAQFTKLNTTFNLGIGASFDVVQKTLYQGSGGLLVNGTDTFTFYASSSTPNTIGVSAQTLFQLKMKLKNGNSFNINFAGALGLIPLSSDDFTYSKNSNNYYTEILSNGSFIRVGIGYDFQLLKKVFGYTSITKINGTNKYIYK